MEPIALEDISPSIDVGPFHGRQRERGGSFYEDYGTLWTATFGDPDSEYWAIRSGAALWDTYALVKFSFSGPDALVALDRLFTRRLTGAIPGIVRYGMLLNTEGLMLDEATVVVVSDTQAYLLGNDASQSFVDHMLAHTSGLDVSIVDVSRAVPCLAVQGPRSFEVMSSITEADISELRWFRCLPNPVEVAGVRGLLLRAGFTGELGYEFYLLDGDAGATTVWDAIVNAGAVPVGLDGIEKVRIEAGLLIAEEDYEPGATDPTELGMQRYLDLDDHSFVGREAVIERARAPQRTFVTLVLDGNDVPAHGAAVFDGDKRVGEVRSADTTPRFGTLALAVVDAAHAAPGTKLTVEGTGCLVHSVPIDDPEKLRPRQDPTAAAGSLDDR